MTSPAPAHPPPSGETASQFAPQVSPFAWCVVAYAVVVLTCLIVVCIRAHGADEQLASIDAKGIPCFELFCPKAHFVASRQLRRNHRLRAADFITDERLAADLAATLPSEEKLLGRYTTRDIERGSAIRPSDLAAQPDPTPAPGSHVVRWALEDKDEADQLEPGMRVAVCTERCSQRLEILAVECTGEESPRCSALLASSRTAAASLLRMRGEPPARLVPYPAQLP
jgi:hypothetical protein